MSGTDRVAKRTRFAFYTRYIADVAARRFELAPAEVIAMNPNTGTLPMFRSRSDADVTLGIYRRHPILIRDADRSGNPWGISFGTLFHMANDSGLFHQPDDLAAAEFNGWSYERDGKECVPLYEAKMLSHFDHRFSTYRGATQAQLNKGTLPRLVAAQHDNADDTEPLARYWVARSEVTKVLSDKAESGWLSGWRKSRVLQTSEPSSLSYFLRAPLVTAVSCGSWTTQPTRRSSWPQPRRLPLTTSLGKSSQAPTCSTSS
jgi:hypothetical protein